MFSICHITLQKKKIWIGVIEDACPCHDEGKQLPWLMPVGPLGQAPAVGNEPSSQPAAVLGNDMSS